MTAEAPRATAVLGRLLARNTALNLAGGIIPPLMGLVTMPYILGGLGIERFGVLSLAWAAMSYFTAFDMGLGRATLKFTSEALGKERSEDVPSIVGTALAWQLALGTLGAALLGIGTPALIRLTMRIAPELSRETAQMFYVLGASIPVVICSLCLRRVVEAAQRFDLANAVRIPAQTSLFWAPAFAVYFGLALPGIALVLLLSQAVAGAAYGAAAMYAIPALRGGVRFDRRLNKPLLSYGGWVAVSSMITPAVAFLDRFMIGALMSMAAVAFYTVPFEMLLRANSVVPSCLAATLFPAFSALGRGRHDDVERIYVRSMKYMLVSMGLLTLVLILFAGDILRLWLGQEFARNSTVVFQFLAFGFLLTGMAWLPTTYLQSLGRPDVVSKIFLVELVGSVPVFWLFIHLWGIQGAAYAMVMRSLFEVLALLVAPAAVMSLRPGALTHRGLVLGWTFIVGLAAASLWIAPLFMEHRGVQASATAAILLGFAAAAWLWVLTESDRGPLMSLAGRKGDSDTE